MKEVYTGLKTKYDQIQKDYKTHSYNPEKVIEDKLKFLVDQYNKETDIKFDLDEVEKLKKDLEEAKKSEDASLKDMLKPHAKPPDQQKIIHDNQQKNPINNNMMNNPPNNKHAGEIDYEHAHPHDIARKEHEWKVKDDFECTDFDATECLGWKDEKNWCVEHMDVMIFSCPVTCGLCGNDGKFCSDLFIGKCPQWKGMGHCDSNYDFMKENCRLSCGYCSRDNQGKRRNLSVVEGNINKIEAPSHDNHMGNLPPLPEKVDPYRARKDRINSLKAVWEEKMMSQDFIETETSHFSNPNFVIGDVPWRYSNSYQSNIQLDQSIVDKEGLALITGNKADYESLCKWHQVNKDEELLRKVDVRGRRSGLRSPLNKAPPNNAYFTGDSTVASPIVFDDNGNINFDSQDSDSNKLLCITYTYKKNHDTNVKSILQTWGPKCDGHLVISDETDDSVNAINLPHNGKEAYNNIWQKIRSTWKYVHTYYREEFDWFVIGGDDMYIIVENLKFYLATLPTSQTTPYFLGRRFQIPKGILFNSGEEGN